MCLRVDVDQADAVPIARERGREIDRRRRFADAALLVDDGDTAHGMKAVSG